MAKKLSMRYEGKAKRVYETDNPALFIVDYKDDATAFNGEKKGQIYGKGVINNRMSNIMFAYLAENGIQTHFVQELSERETLVKQVEIVPLEVIVRNIAAGSFAKRFGVEEGTPLSAPSLEFSYKNDALGDPMINEYQILALGLSTKEELQHISEQAFAINSLMQQFFLKKNIILVDFKIEFGRVDGVAILADEISPDTCRLWDATTHEKLDKDRFRRDLGSVEEAYEEVFRRLTEN